MAKQTLLFLLCVLGGIQLSAQQGATASGGEATGPGGSISYSIGQPFYQTAFSPDYTLQAGVQQAYEISEVSSVWTLGGTVELSVFPNPTSDYLRVVVQSEELLEWQCRVYDLGGRLIQIHQSTDSALLLPFQTLAAGTYLVEVRVAENQSKTFQIIKANL